MSYLESFGKVRFFFFIAKNIFEIKPYFKKRIMKFAWHTFCLLTMLVGVESIAARITNEDLLHEVAEGLMSFKSLLS